MEQRSANSQKEEAPALVGAASRRGGPTRTDASVACHRCLWLFRLDRVGARLFLPSTGRVALLLQILGKGLERVRCRVRTQRFLSAAVYGRDKERKGGSARGGEGRKLRARSNLRLCTVPTRSPKMRSKGSSLRGLRVAHNVAPLF